ncbi:hypothetical protein NQ318_003137 [Aromia moschata]|uniref:Reverse transcriptase domain-containing protein n=1 Tax=Aromia moschata TaxID=1265417 RepID=A0AAV8YUK4_9CUCU|nr:hypothetical protein NQ318_003137 [Aromia moschata]
MTSPLDNSRESLHSTIGRLYGEDIYLKTRKFDKLRKKKANFYEQKNGAAIGSPLSPVNLFIEAFEEEAIRSSDKKPKCWLRYVDETFIIWPHGQALTKNGYKEKDIDRLCRTQRERVEQQPTT